ncbi:MAG: hypothetical protein A3G33_04895 [Omnitrophica bacterium RIFCSPLOWO2_12_FULL_44_17]|uniref:NodB homology domain-containing protein n=1 Tax=Candidatus Danuiimicrobium aquiferis TaxID=1801832 RepID=A0A1G1KQT2_9BACT|nr:MAG: hypothetical protein A3B72_11110 [Omnitrophica bacterium RIFCSPHIGHO2_02_FULL_45_28]OGW95266.1 MAG: hypothetical protein A3G33_04895 [Omnitrophica bacterium RIFCSPLOWO2_12_FULL_44_17]OGX02361.1 MAG: hypothetical protein A3J12_10230 [Omnitrophica bacterium RIFCSPLOWO2_02_FULL_44_11]
MNYFNPFSSARNFFQYLSSLTCRRPFGLVYHVVSDQSLPHIRHLFPYKKIEYFEADLIYLKENYHLLTYDELKHRTKNPAKLKKDEIFISFDDGYSECFTIIRPLLKKYRIPCVFFVATDFIDNRAMFYRNQLSLCIDKIIGSDEKSWQTLEAQINSAIRDRIEGKINWISHLKSLNYPERDTINIIGEILELDFQKYLNEQKPYLSSESIQSLSSDGFTIGAHSQGHAKFKWLKESEMAEDIQKSCHVIQALTGAADTPFAFPFSVSRSDLNGMWHILSKHKSAGLLFNSGKFVRSNMILNRIPADKPPSGSKTNLPELIQAAHSAR